MASLPKRGTEAASSPQRRSVGGSCVDVHVEEVGCEGSAVTVTGETPMESARKQVERIVGRESEGRARGIIRSVSQTACDSERRASLFLPLLLPFLLKGVS